MSERWQRQDLELTVEPEPVRRRPPDDGHPFAVILGLSVAAIVAIAIAALIANAATPPSGPGPSAFPPDSQVQSGAPRPTVDAIPTSSGTELGAAESGNLRPSANAQRRSGWATYCAPTPTRCQSWGGDARVAGVQSFRWGDEPYDVLVSSFLDGRTRTSIVTVVSYCACGDRHGIPTVIDLSPAAFRDLTGGSLTRGVIRVTVDDLRGIPPAPRTDR